MDRPTLSSTWIVYVPGSRCVTRAPAGVGERDREARARPSRERGRWAPAPAASDERDGGSDAERRGASVVTVLPDRRRSDLPAAQLRAEPLARAPRRSARGARPRPRRRASARPTGRRARARPTSGPRRPARRGRRRRPAPRGAPRRPPRAPRRQVAGRHVLGDREREVLLHRRIRDHVLVQRHRPDGGEERLQVELEDPPRPFEPRRMELADPAGLGARRLAGVEHGSCVRSTAARRREPRSSVSSDALHAEEAALRIPPTRRRSSGSSPPEGGTRARSRTARCRRCRRSTFRCAALDEPVEQRRPQRGLVLAHRVDQRGAARRDRARRVRLGEPGPDEHVLDQPAQPLVEGQPAEHLAPRRQRERHLLEARRCGRPPRSRRPRA